MATAGLLYDPATTSVEIEHESSYTPGGLESMDETTEFVKRGLEENLDDEDPTSMKGMTPAPNPWLEKNKGRYET
ncbi:hypothetical protein HPB47_001001 [Ixodes persulcatus]|uniref:Uncharacterized protein n=1 Tax=Ixodes persulcatus TaxID=34615 RepID=A0AC60PR01_IXOPE|nr:hypothetical protein HPB47_001001 [Ixodes persulcatus]